ncbi:hypothetical protein ON010_g7314 [Phytophthora cinnamomi]|nr:hypothetical protein ON010_g7314 [Phytophthora cinnamomi]
MPRASDDERHINAQRRRRATRRVPQTWLHCAASRGTGAARSTTTPFSSDHLGPWELVVDLTLSGQLAARPANEKSSAAPANERRIYLNMLRRPGKDGGDLSRRNGDSVAASCGLHLQLPLGSGRALAVALQLLLAAAAGRGSAVGGARAGAARGAARGRLQGAVSAFERLQLRLRPVVRAAAARARQSLYRRHPLRAAVRAGREPQLAAVPPAVRAGQCNRRLVLLRGGSSPRGAERPGDWEMVPSRTNLRPIQPTPRCLPGRGKSSLGRGRVAPRDGVPDARTERGGQGTGRHVEAVGACSSMGEVEYVRGSLLQAAGRAAGADGQVQQQEANCSGQARAAPVGYDRDAVQLPDGLRRVQFVAHESLVDEVFGGRVSVAKVGFQGEDGRQVDSYAYFTYAGNEHRRRSQFQLNFLGSESFSFDVWFSLLPGSDGTQFGGILYGLQSASRESRQWPYYHQQFVLVSSTGDLYCSVLDTRPVVASNLQSNWWYHLALSYDNEHQRQEVYLDGAKIHSSTGTLHHEWGYLSNEQVGTGCITAGDLNFPRPKYLGWYGFHGVIDDFRIWTGTLSQDDVSKLVRGGSLQTERLRASMKTNYTGERLVRPLLTWVNVQLTICTRPAEGRSMQQVEYRSTSQPNCVIS